MENSEQEQEEQQQNITKNTNLQEDEELQQEGVVVEVEAADLKDINIDVENENESGVDSINISQEQQPIEDPLDITDNFSSSNVQEHENGDHFMSQAGPYVNNIIELKPEIIENVNNSLESTPLPNGITLPFSFPGQSFSEQSQKLILNVWDFFKRAKRDPKLIHSLKGPQDHASAALNVGTKTIGKIAKRVLRLGKLETPGKKRNRPKTVLDSVDEEGEKVLRTIIRELYDRKTAPTISLVLAEAKERINFKGSTTSLRRILKRMGFKYGGLNNTMIQSDKSNVSGWKEKSMKKNWKSKSSTTNPTDNNNSTTSTTTKRKSEGKKARTNNSNGNLNSKKQSRKKTAQIMEQQQQLQHQPIEISAHEVIEAHEIIESHELLQPHEVIIHYQKQSESGDTHSFLTQSGSTQMITVTDPREILQLQLNSNGQTQTVPVQVVHEWNYEC